MEKDKNGKMNRYFCKLTNQQVLDEYKKDQPVWSIEMGGMGPTYEISIQLAMFKLWAYLHARKINIRNPDAKLLKKIDRILYKYNLSGAGHGAAKSLAFKFHHFSYGEIMRDAAEARLIMVDNCKFLKEIF